MASALEETGEGSPATTDGYIELRNVRKTFNDGEVVACEDMNVSIGESEFIIFLGPSGCGKTTTLRSIAGLEQPDEGEILINGEDVIGKRPKDRNLAFVFQDIALFPHKTVRENISFGLDMKTDLSTEEKNRKIESAAETLGIAELLDRKPSVLSGGQQQRVSLGRAMVLDPDAFLLDEPFAALDAKLKDAMETEVKELQRELNTSMIFVTHDQKEALSLGDRIIVMNEGRIQQIGTPYEIYNDPVNLFVSQFIGSPTTNIFDCIVENEGGRTRVIHDLFTLDVSDRNTSLEDSQNVRLGVRPEDTKVNSSSPQFEGEVMLVEPEGTNDVVHIEANDTELMAYPPQNEVADEGATVPIGIAADNIWLFDTSGQRLL